MPNICNNETIETIAENYCSNSFNKSQALITTGYDEAYAKSGTGLKIYDNLRVKAAIAKRMALNCAKIDVTVKFIVEKLLLGLTLAEEKKDLVAIARFTELLGRYKAMFTEKIQQTGDGLRINITPAASKPVPVLPAAAPRSSFAVPLINGVVAATVAGVHYDAPAATIASGGQ